MEDVIIKFSKRAPQSLSTPSLSLTQTLIELRESGMEVTNFGSRPDVPDHVIKAAKLFLDSGKSSAYTDARGLKELRNTISKKLKKENFIEANPETEIVVTLGGKEAIFASLMALVESGDEVLIEDPGWFCFKSMVQLTGATAVPVNLFANDNFLLKSNVIEISISTRSKVLLLCNPHNPTGVIHSKVSLNAIAKLALKHNLIVIADEAWQHLMYDGIKHVSITTLDGMSDRTVTVNTTSKVYNMAGWRVGWASGPKKIIEKITAIQSTSVTCPTSIAQAGAIAALNDTIGMGNLSFSQLIEQFSTRRDLVREGILKIPGVNCINPLGGIFMFPDFSYYQMESVNLSNRLLNEAGIGSVPGLEFGLSGENHLRILFTSPPKEIARGLERMQSFFKIL